jgi:gas vesicle protein
MKKETNNVKIVLGALLAGAAIGGTLGILFAPAKGSDTRKKIANKGVELKDDLQAKYEELIAETKIIKEKLTA